MQLGDGHDDDGITREPARPPTSPIHRHFGPRHDLALGDGGVEHKLARHDLGVLVERLPRHGSASPSSTGGTGRNHLCLVPQTFTEALDVVVREQCVLSPELAVIGGDWPA